MMTTQTTEAEADANADDVMPADMLALGAPERWKRALKALYRTMQDPTRTDQVLLFTGYANAGTLAKRTALLEGNAQWEALYAAHRAIDSKTLDIPALLALPAGTLGHAYATFLTSHGLTPEVFDGPPGGVKDPRTAYAIQRLRQTHDLWHVVTGYETDFVGEIALQAFTYAQLGAPSSGILALVGTLRAVREVPWLAKYAMQGYRAGKRAEPFAAFAWEDNWSTPLAEVRARLGVTPVAPRERIELAASSRRAA